MGGFIQVWKKFFLKADQLCLTLAAQNVGKYSVYTYLTSKHIYAASVWVIQQARET